MVDYGYLIVKYVWICVIMIKAFLEHGLIVKVQRQSTCVVSTWTLERTARLDFEHVVAAVAVLVDPFAYRVAGKRRLDLAGPTASIGENSTMMVIASDLNIGGGWRDDEFQRSKCNHHERHAGGKTAGSMVISEPSLRLIGNAVFQHFLILRRQGRLLPESPRLGLVERRLAGKPEIGRAH